MTSLDADISMKTESPAENAEQLTTTQSIALPEDSSKTPTPQPLKKQKVGSTPVPQSHSQSAASGPPPLPEDLNAADVIGGSPLRRYINKNLTAELIQGIKKCVAERPDRPLKWLGEWLIARDEQLITQQEDKDVKIEG